LGVVAAESAFEQANEAAGRLRRPQLIGSVRTHRLRTRGGRLTLTDDLLQASEAIRHALLNNDTDSLIRLLSDDYCGFDPSGGRQDRAMMLQAYAPGGVQLQTYETSDMATRIVGDVGLVMGLGTLSGRYGDHRFRHTLRFLDVYVRRGSTWQLSLSQVTELSPAD